MLSLRPFLLLCVLFPIQLVRADNNWYAVFWNATLKQQLNQTFQSYTKLTPNDNSANQFQCDHTTIAFHPADTTPYIPRLGMKQSAHILAYAHDEHGQAILLRYDGTDYIPTLNSFPHTTISDENVGPYSAVYSNDLWARVNASGFVNITFRTGFPDTIVFADSTNVVNNQLTFTLPNITIGANVYTESKVQVTIYPPGTIFGLEGIFCVNIGWDGSVCTPPASSSSSSSSSSSAGTSTSTAASSTVASSSSSSSSVSAGPSTSTAASSAGASSSSSTGSSSLSSLPWTGPATSSTGTSSQAGPVASTGSSALPSTARASSSTVPSTGSTGATGSTGPSISPTPSPTGTSPFLNSSSSSSSFSNTTHTNTTTPAPWASYVAGDCQATCGLKCTNIQVCYIDTSARICKCAAESGAVTGIIIAVLIGLGVLMFLGCFVARCGVFSYRASPQGSAPSAAHIKL